MIAGHLAPELRTIPTREQMPDTLAQSAAEIMLSHGSALSHSGSSADRKEILAVGMATHSGSHGLRMSPMELPGPDTTWLEVLLFP